MNYVYTFTSTSTGMDTIKAGETTVVNPADRLFQVEKEKEVLEAEQQILLNKALQSDDPNTLIKAQTFLDDMIAEESRSDGGVAIINDPGVGQYSIGGYKTKKFQMTPLFLRKMANTTIIRSIITTRQAQVTNFSTPQKNKYDMGFIVEKVSDDHYSTETPETTPEDTERINYITNFLLDGGDNASAKKGLWNTDTFETFLKKIVDDSLTLDAAAFEIVDSRRGSPAKYFAIDAGTIFQAHVDGEGNYEAKTGSVVKEIMGYKPSFVQVIDERIVADFYPWELCFGIRNARTDIYQNGYGRSELEDLVNIINWQLNADQYNGRFFTQGSNPKGILKVPKGANRNRVAQLRQEWLSMVAGTKNAHKIPILEGEGIEWIDLHKGNADMQFNEWQQYLIKVICALYKIAPEEIGFNLDNTGGLNAESNAEVRLKFSRDKGLYPLLKSIEAWINRWIVQRIDPKYRFRFVGLNVEAESEDIDKTIKLAGSVMTLKEARKKLGLPADIEEDDIILNQVWMQNKQADDMMNASLESEEALEDELSWDNVGDGDDDFERGIDTLSFEHQNNPMMIDAMATYKKLVSDER